MSLEIERKFLVTSDSWRSFALCGRRLCDAMACYGTGKIRIRLEESSASVAFKGRRCGMNRLEVEYRIPLEDAEELIRILQPRHLILKTRYWVPVQGIMWFVDVHESPFGGLVTAEVELDNETQPLSLPSWMGEELTGTPIELAFQMSQSPCLT